MSSPDESLKRLCISMEETFARLFRSIEKASEWDDQDALEKLSEEIEESAFGVQVVRHLHVVLAGGGPAVYLDIELDLDGSVSDVHWIGAWWGEPLIAKVLQGSGLWQFAERMAELHAYE